MFNIITHRLEKKENQIFLEYIKMHIKIKKCALIFPQLTTYYYETIITFSVFDYKLTTLCSSDFHMQLLQFP